MDFNFHNIDWENHSVKDLNGVQFLESVQESFLKQYVETPTCERATLDLALGNWERQVNVVCVEEPFGSSDHSSIRFKIVMYGDGEGPRVKMHNWVKANFEGMRENLAQVDWSMLFEGKSGMF